MRNLVVNTFASLDGVMQAPGGPEEDPSGGFILGGWSVTYWDESMMETMEKTFSVDFDLLLGRKTYEIFAAHWPHVTDDPDAGKLNSARKYVATTTLTEATWQNSRILTGDVAAEVARLKEGNGPEIHVHGSSHLLQTLLRHGLVDEFRLWIFPVVLGSGKRLFGDGTVPSNMELVESKLSSTGVHMTTYRPSGDVPIGTFALEDQGEE